MEVSKVNLYGQNHITEKVKNNVPNKEAPTVNTEVQRNYAKIPAGYTYGAKIHFGAKDRLSERQLVQIPTIEHEQYIKMRESTKERYRRICENFVNMIGEKEKQKLLSIDPHPEYMKIPLQSEKDMDNFIKVAKMYAQYKDHPIISLGRSPKWFLNASLLMKDGIPDYKFVAFSGRWYNVFLGDFGDNRGLVRVDSEAPTKAEERAYRKYLKNIQADPASIVKKAKEAGKKVIITDYVDTGKGFSSFLDLMSRYAQDQGVLDEFGHSISILTIGSQEYRRQRRNLKDFPGEPHVLMPKLLEPYGKATTAWGTGQIIEQKYFDIDYDVFKQMLLNQNTNECRSTYYPHTAWTIYQPNKVKVGLITDMKKIKNLLSKLGSENEICYFEPVVRAYRNLLNFTLMDKLNTRGLLKAVHHTKI